MRNPTRLCLVSWKPGVVCVVTVVWCGRTGGFEKGIPRGGPVEFDNDEGPVVARVPSTHGV